MNENDKSTSCLLLFMTTLVCIFIRIIRKNKKQNLKIIQLHRYWTEIVVTGLLPLLALICLNYGIYAKIRKSAKFRRLHDNTIKFRRTTTTTRDATTRQEQQRKSDTTVEDNSHDNQNNLSAMATTATTVATTTRVQIASVTSCATYVERKQLFCATSSPVESRANSGRNRSHDATGSMSLNVDSQRAAPLQSMSAHHTTFIRRPGKDNEN